MRLDQETCYRALVARDARFDGVFFVGVTTTGIYCRPVCTARTPRFERCRFFSNAALAEKDGFRPCLRCRPELAPGHAPIDAVGNLARLAAARIEAGALNDGGNLEQLARELKISSRQLRRAIRQEFGVSPVELAQTNRLLLAKRLLAETSLPMIDLALASGFASVRRFNALFREHYGLAPSQVRRSRRGTDERGSIRLTLAKQGVEPPHAGEPAGQREVDHRQARLRQQPLGQEQPIRLRQLDRRDAELLANGAAKLARTDLQLPREFFEIAPVVERSGLDPGRGAAGEVPDRIDGGVARRELGPAAQAGAKPVFFREGRVGKEPAPLEAGRPRRANRPAVNSGCRHPHEEHAVEPHVACGQRPVTVLTVEVHYLKCINPFKCVWPFSDIDAGKMTKGEIIETRRLALRPAWKSLAYYGRPSVESQTNSAIRPATVAQAPRKPAQSISESRGISKPMCLKRGEASRCAFS